MWRYESICVNYHDHSVVLAGTVASAEENREHSIRRNSLFPQQPSKHCKNSPSEPDRTVQTNHCVLIGGMWCAYKYPDCLETWSQNLFWSDKRMRVHDFQGERETHSFFFFLSLTKSLCLTRRSCEECWERKSFLSCISRWKKRERGGELSKLNACHTLFLLHDASRHCGGRAVSRSGDVTPIYIYIYINC